MEVASNAGGAPQACCVLWHGRHDRAPEELSAALNRRGVSVARVVGAYTALAEACRLGGRSRTIVAGPGSAILVLAEPASLGCAATVARAVARYAPHVSIWVYESGANPKLRALVEEDVEAWERVAVRSDKPAMTADRAPAIAAEGPRVRVVRGAGRTGAFGGSARAAPVLRLTEDDDVDTARRSAAPAGDTDEEAPRQLLTSEELAMLLADDERPGTGGA